MLLFSLLDGPRPCICAPQIFLAVEQAPSLAQKSKLSFPSTTQSERAVANPYEVAKG